MKVHTITRPSDEEQKLPDTDLRLSSSQRQNKTLSGQRD